MAIMASQSPTSSKKHGAHESHDERDAKRARPNESGTTNDHKEAHKPSSAAAETEDDTLENPYDNVACTD
jgi:hypothetical protein